MNATQNLLMLIQQMSANMSLPNVSTSKNGQSSVSFEDMLNKASTSAAPKDKVSAKDAQSTDAVQDKAEAPKDADTARNVTDDGEEKTAYQMVGAAVNPYAELVQPNIQPVEEETFSVTIDEMLTVKSAPLEEDVPTGSTQPTVVEGSFELPEEAVEETEQQIAPETVEKTAEEQPELKIHEVKVERQDAPAEDSSDDEHIEGYEAESTERPLFKDAEAAPVKVGERYEIDTESEEMDSQLTNSIQQAMTAGMDHVEIRLTPENLGALTIQMTRDDSGALQIVLHTTNSKAASLLGQHLDSLHIALQNLGHDTVHVEVQRSEESAQEQSMHQQANPDGHSQNRQDQPRRQKAANPEDFLQQLRLGLFSVEDVI